MDTLKIVAMTTGEFIIMIVISNWNWIVSLGEDS